MKRVLIIMLFAAATIAISGCKEKTTEEKIKDAAKAAQSDADAASADLNKRMDAAGIE